jgi:outer membrane protein insertion porin family
MKPCRAWRRIAACAVLALGMVAVLVPLAARSAVAQSPGGVVIREIRVEGIERIEPETVRSYLPLRAGAVYDPRQIDVSLKALFATGLFSDVGIRLEGDVVIVWVTENPIINRVAFEGNDVVETSVLLAETQLRSRVVYTRTRVQNDVKRLQDLYRRQGRFAAMIVPKVITRSQNRVDLIFEIKEGEPTKIRKITFIGNRVYSDTRLRSIIASAETRWYSFLTGDDFYDPDRLLYDQESLRRYYLKNGYPEFNVLSAMAELSPDQKTFFLTFTVDEGKRYTFGDFEIESQLKALDAKKLRSSVSYKPGDTYNAEEVEKTVNALTDAVGSLGYAFVEVRPEPKRDKETRKVNMTYSVREGPRTYIERIELGGNVRTEDRVIRREFRLVEGDAFNAAKYRLSQRWIRDLNYFKDVKFEQVPGSAPDKTVIKAKVQEKSTGSLSLGVGVTSNAGFVSQVTLTERNLLGKGQQLSLSASLGTTEQQFDIRFTEPYFLGRNLAAGFDLFNTRRRKTASIAFEQAKAGAGVRLGFRYNEHLYQNVGYKVESREISDVDTDASLYVKRQEGKNTTSALTQSIAYDVRDSRIEPTEGYVVRLSNQLAGLGGDSRYLETVLSATSFYSTVFDSVLRVGGKIGYIVGLGRDIRIDERFFIGGDELLGFQNGGIGPRDEATGDALGGKQYATAVAELGIPLMPANSFKPRGYLYTNAGTMSESDENGTGIQDDDLIRVGAGVGIGFSTPFGAIRFNLTQALRKASFDKTEVFSFRFGTTF